MTVFTTRYGEPIARVLSAYPPNSKPLMIALEAIVKTAIENTKSEARDEIAVETCLNLHAGLGSGLICRRCFDTIESGRMSPEPGDIATPTKEEVEEISQIERNVKAMIAAVEKE